VSGDDTRETSREERLEQALTDAPVGQILQSQAPEPSKSGLVRSGVTVMLFAAAANGLNVVFHFAVARFLPPAEYALLTTIFAINIIATVPLIAVQATVAREMAILLGSGDVETAGAVLRTTYSVVFRFALGVCMLIALLAWPATVILHIERPLPIIAASLSIAAAVPLPAAWGALQAAERFTALSLIQALGTVLKLVLGVGVAALGFGASAITFGVVLANLVAFGCAWKFLRPVLRAAHQELLPRRRVVGRYAVGSAVCLGLLTLLTQSDVIWARGVLPAHGAGDYAAASVMGNFLLLLPIGVTTVLFPRIAQMGDDPASRRPLVRGLAAVGALSVPLLALFAGLPHLLLSLAFGAAYTGAAPLLLPLGVAMTGYAFVTVYMNHFLAQGRTRFAAILVACIAMQQVLFLLAHTSPASIVWVQVATGSTAALAAEGYERLMRSRLRRSVNPRAAA
jgi:O-antigen/teichoic acid export membrane protein